MYFYYFYKYFYYNSESLFRNKIELLWNKNNYYGIKHGLYFGIKLLLNKIFISLFRNKSQKLISGAVPKLSITIILRIILN